MQVTFLGTNGWYDSATGNTVSALISARDFDIILDAGNGIAKVDQYLTQEKPVFLFLSHFHLDHTEGLHVLVKFRFKKGLTICGGAGTRTNLAGLLREPYTVPLEEVPFPTTVTELAEGATELPFRVTCLPLVHPVPCMGYRFEIDGKVVTYCTDTGVCDNAVTLARDADLLITECGLKPGEKSPLWPHMNPEDAIGVAHRAGAKRLALMHFGAEVYKTMEERRALKVQFEKDCPGLVVSEDGMTIEV
ncbi:ribonuclease Z [Methanoregula sp.]|uniref:MBL fold metallo-hydrolase n=1 Tax=Methanoregula sp. TaxID=2052170 RepID=UPI002C43AA79|nr:ribonuclease Z [Methanoregula sp.]HVP96217.1 ribonuclease Z [Methanoregula sp.]